MVELDRRNLLKGRHPTLSVNRRWDKMVTHQRPGGIAYPSVRTRNEAPAQYHEVDQGDKTHDSHGRVIR